MKNLFNSDDNNEIVQRFQTLPVTSKPQWGSMNVTQMVAHCANSIEMSIGKIKPKRNPVGIFLGRLIKHSVLSGNAPMRKNTPTSKELIAAEYSAFDEEKKRLINLIAIYNTGDRSVCTEHPHPFFGRLNPDEWSRLMYLHLNHHLNQFGA